MTRLRPPWLLPGLVLALVTACTGGTGEAARAPADPSSPATSETSPVSPTGEPSPSPSPSQPPSPSPTPSRTASPPHPVSLPGLFDKQYDGRRLRRHGVLARTDAYTQREVTYRSGDLTISGVMNLPHGRGPFPVLVLAHGYIDPAYYVTGQGMRREQDWLARAGYAVLHVDYRNHAGSDDDPRAERRLRLGYTVDVVNAVHAVRRAGRTTIPRLDSDRVGLVGRSMGGGVVYNVLTVAPGLVDAVVVFAPVSSWTPDNFNRWIRSEPGRDRLSDAIIDAYGTPERNSRFWRQVSPRTYFDRVTEPVLIHHGTADESCPIRWSRASLRALRRADVRARMFTYPGEPHAFIAAWSTSMRRTVRFLDRHLA